MHFDILVEDVSGKEALEIIVPKIVNCDEHTFTVHAYKGIGKIPENMNANVDASKRILLSNLPRLLMGYGAVHSKNRNYPMALIIVCDLDSKVKSDFIQELNDILFSCNPRPNAKFCIAIEEGEAWFLGDIPAIKSTYNNAKDAILNAYVNDSICGTWEVLADAVYYGGAKKLKEQGWCAAGAEKSKWAKDISPFMNVNANNSPSFIFFRDTLLALANGA